MSPRILGVDPGERRVGIAISDPTCILASPLEVIDRTRSGVADRIDAICREYDVETIVVGLPVSLSGEEGESAARARALGEEIASATERNLVYWDERFTSVEAERSMIEAGVRRKQRRETTDKVAAAVLLQGYLDHQNRAHS